MSRLELIYKSVGHRLGMALTAALLLTSTPLAAQDTERTQNQQQLELDGSAIIGNEESPIGLDIVPWRSEKIEAPEAGVPRLVDDSLEPIDPEVFRRELDLYQRSR